MRGSVTDISGGAPVAGASVSISLGQNPTLLTTDAAGAWEISRTAATPTTIPVEVSAAGFISRQTQLRWDTGAREGAVIDLIRDAAPFSLQYYRELVRNAHSDPDGGLRNLRRWTAAPNFYIDTRNPKSGGTITAQELERLHILIREAVPQMTGGRFQAGSIESGPRERAPRLGYINLKFFHDPNADRCGSAVVGANPGQIELNYGAAVCGTKCGEFPWRAVVHEVGHALGFYHVAEGRVMNVNWFDRDCDRTTFSDVEQFHALIAYSRANGNRDPDIDPSSTLLMQPEDRPERVSCR